MVTDLLLLSPTVLHIFPMKWSWKVVSRSICVSLQDMKMNGLEDLSWWWGAGGLSINPHICMEFVVAYPSKSWDWDCLCANPAININQIISYYPNKIYNYNKFQLNPSITMELICNNLDKNWGFYSYDVQAVQQLYFNLFAHGVEYITKYCCIYSILTIHDEDYDRYEMLIELQIDTAIDTVIQNQYLISNILEYI